MSLKVYYKRPIKFLTLSSKKHYHIITMHHQLLQAFIQSMCLSKKNLSFVANFSVETTQYKPLIHAAIVLLFNHSCMLPTTGKPFGLLEQIFTPSWCPLNKLTLTVPVLESRSSTTVIKWNTVDRVKENTAWVIVQLSRCHYYIVRTQIMRMLRMLMNNQHKCQTTSRSTPKLHTRKAVTKLTTWTTIKTQRNTHKSSTTNKEPV